MAEETEREEIKEKTLELEDEELGEKEDKGFELGIKEPQQDASENEEEKEEILLTTPAETKKPKSASKTKSSPGKRQPSEIGSADMRKHLERQTAQLNKITLILQSIQKDIKSTNGQSKLIKQVQSQLKQLQNRLSQIQKIMRKKGSTILTTPPKKKTLNPKRLKKKR
jgi:hypothetical protein